MPAWIVIAVAFAAGCCTLAAAESRTRRRTALRNRPVACASGLWLNRQDWSVRFARVERMSAENRFVLELREGDILRQPLTLAASLRELEWMKEAVYRRPRGGSWFQDDLYLCLHPGGSAGSGATPRRRAAYRSHATDPGVAGPALLVDPLRSPVERELPRRGQQPVSKT